MKGMVNITLSELLDGNVTDSLFDYSADEIKDFHLGFNKTYLPTLYESVSKELNNKNKYSKLGERYNILADFLKKLNSKDLKIFEEAMVSFTDSSPNMLWNMLNKIDHKLYKTPNNFHDWLSTLSSGTLDHYIMRVTDNKPLHSPAMYETLVHGTTKVEVLDGYIAISSSNLQALDKFRDRILFSNTCDYEHRIKKHKGITIHSYVFNMNKQDSN